MDDHELRVRAPVPVPVELQHRIEQFLYFEARLLDEWRWREWFDLLADDLHYWMPTRANRLRVRDFSGEVVPGVQSAHFDDDKQSMESRVGQLESPTHWAERPPSRTRHLITNVSVHAVREEAGADILDVSSYFLCYRNHLERDVDIWAGERDDVLRATGEHGFQIAKRTIVLDQTVVRSKNISVFF